MNEQTDEVLLAAVALDDKAAFRALTERYLDRVWRVANNILGNRQDAEDVTQEVFITLWNKRTEWQEGEAKFSTWLYRVAFNRAIDFKRRRKVNHVELHEDIAADGSGADRLAADQQTRALFMECLRQLPEKQMLCLLLFYYEELDIAEICDKLDSTENSVRSLLKRGRQNLKGILHDRFGHELSAIQRTAPDLWS